MSTPICTPGAAACATPTDAGARSAHASKTTPASHPDSPRSSQASPHCGLLSRRVFQPGTAKVKLVEPASNAKSTHDTIPGSELHLTRDGHLSILTDHLDEILAALT